MRLRTLPVGQGRYVFILDQAGEVDPDLAAGEKPAGAEGMIIFAETVEVPEIDWQLQPPRIMMGLPEPEIPTRFIPETNAHSTEDVEGPPKPAERPDFD